MTTTTTIETAALYRLMAWFSPAYPIGAFSYSHGLEAAVEAGMVRDRASLIAWIEGLLAHGTGHVDAALFVEAWRAASGGDRGRLDDVAELAAAWRGTAELSLESRQQGRSFVDATRKAWPDALGEGVMSDPPLVIAVAAACRAVPLEAGLTAFLHGFVANLCSAAVRAVPLGQSDGQAALAALQPAVAATVVRAMEEPLDAVGAAHPLLDLLSIAHETQYTRLFRS